MDMNVEYAAGWRPEEGDVLVGTVTSVDLGHSNWGGSYPIITVDPGEGEDAVAVHCFHTGLKQRVMALKPMRGEVIGFQYKGKQPHKTDRTKEVAVYVVKVKGRDADVWGALAGESAPAPIATQPHPTEAPVDTSDFAPRDPERAQTNDDDDIPF
jgi:hypothetical protein